jgi:hypothetical protein
MTPINNILGMSVKDIIGGQTTTKSTLEGGGVITYEDESSPVIPRTPTFVPHYGVLTDSIANRIAELSVPIGLVYIPENSHHKLEFRSTKPYTYETIPEDLYDKLLDLVSINDKSNKQSKSKSKHPKIKGGNSTRRIT